MSSKIGYFLTCALAVSVVVACSSALVTQEKLAVPGPLAAPCANDNECGTHRCNVTYGRCAFPCETHSDCTGGAVCSQGPGLPGLCVANHAAPTR